MRVARIACNDLISFTSTSGAPTIDAGRLKFACGGTNYAQVDMPYTGATLIWIGLRVNYDTYTAANQIFAWLRSGTVRGDFRFNSAGKIEARVNGSVVATGSKIFLTGTEYHLQFFISIGAYAQLQMRVDDRALYDIDYFSNSPVSFPLMDGFRFGSFSGGGSGDGYLDDIIINDFVVASLHNVGWPGDIRIVETAPNNTGASITNQWDVVPSGTAQAALDETPHNSDTDYIKTHLNRARTALIFDNPTPPAGGVLEAVGFRVVVKSTHANTRVKLRFRRDPAIETPTNQVWTLTITGGAGTFSLSYDGVPISGIAYNASVATVQGHINTILSDTVGGVQCVVSGSPSNYVFTFGGGFTQTRTLPLESIGVSGATATMVLTTAGKPIYEQGTPFGFIEPEKADSIGDAYNEVLADLGPYAEKNIRRARAVDGATWNTDSGNEVQLVVRAQGLPVES